MGTTSDRDDRDTAADARWEATDMTGARVALRHVPDDVRAALSRLATSSVRPGQPGTSTAGAREGVSGGDPGRTGSREGAGGDDEPGGAEWDVLAALIAAGRIEVRPLLVDIDDDVTNPVWWVSGGGARDGIVTLADALYELDDHQRAGAIVAHVDLLAELAAHEAAAAAIADGAPVAPRCAACIAEPELHAVVLHDSVEVRGRELAEAWALYDVTVTVSGRRAL